MEQQPRDESRAATVREGGDESWTEAGEMIDHPTNLPTAAGSREPSGDIPPGAGEATSGRTPTTPADDLRLDHGPASVVVSIHRHR